MLLFQKLDRSVHNRRAFSCGVPELDNFLKRYAAQNQDTGDSTTHVLVDSDNPSSILGFVSLSTAQLEFKDLSADDLRHFPHYPVSALRIGRLAVSLQARGKGYGGALLGFSVRQALKIRDIAGVRILLVDAKDEQAENFYKHFGFTTSSSDASILYLVI